MRIPGLARARALARRRRLESQLVWVFGSPRSGSTWLLEMLGHDPRVVTIDEPMIGWYLAPFVADIPGADPAAVDMENCTLGRLQRWKGSQFFSEEFKGAWQPALRRLILERLYAEVVAAETETPFGRRVIAIKEPSGSQAADVILEALPRSRLLFLLRDGRDVVDSALAASRPGAWAGREAGGAFKGIEDAERLEFVADAAYKWLWRTEIVEQAFRAHDGPKLQLRYEDLLADPATQLGSLLEWLGLEMPEAEVRSVAEQHAFERIPPQATGPAEFYRAAKPGLWRENFSDAEQAEVERILGPKLRSLGYET